MHNICSGAVCNIVCLSYETVRESLASTQEAAYRLCNAVHSMLELYADFIPSRCQDQISSLPLMAGVFLILLAVQLSHCAFVQCPSSYFVMICRF